MKNGERKAKGTFGKIGRKSLCQTERERETERKDSFCVYIKTSRDIKIQRHAQRERER